MSCQRDSLGISLEGNVVIFDEAHNLVDAVNANHSFAVGLSQLKGASRCGRGESGRKWEPQVLMGGAQGMTA